MSNSSSRTKLAWSSKLRYALAGSLFAAAVFGSRHVLGKLLTADGEFDLPGVDTGILLLRVVAALLGLTLWTWRRSVGLLAGAAILGLAAFVGLHLDDFLTYRDFVAEYHGPTTVRHELLQSANRAQLAGEASLDKQTAEVLYRLRHDREEFEALIPASQVVLDVGFGVAPRAERLLEGRMFFEVWFEPTGGASRRLFRGSTSLSPDSADHHGWQQATIDLSSLAGSAGKFELRKAFASSDKAAARIFDLDPTDLAFWQQARIRPRRLGGRKNVILVSLDTARADRFGFMGYERDTSPNLDRLASDSVVFTRAFSHAPWTYPSHLSLFTGTHPRTHGGKTLPSETTRVWNRELPNLARTLRDAGYKTAAFTEGRNVSAAYGFNDGFDIYDESSESAVQMMDRTLPWIEDNADRTFFLFLHTFEPHKPYEGRYFLEREGIDENDAAAVRSALYDGDIRTADAQMGRLIDSLERLDLLDETLLIVTSDHGEALVERGWPHEEYVRWGHGHSLYDEVLHVPLLLSGFAESRESSLETAQVRLIDVFPTVLDYLELALPPSIEGESLKSMIEGSAGQSRPVFAEATSDGPEREAVRTEKYKYIYRRSYGYLPNLRSRGLELGPREELFDLEEDPGELVNLAASRPDIVAEMSALVRSITGRDPFENVATEQTEDPDYGHAERLEGLRALGYVD